MLKILAYAATSKTSPLVPHIIERRLPGPDDVLIDILYCGICHSDLHLARDEWSGVVPAVYPLVPGHEIVGRVRQVGNQVSRFKVGDTVGVGGFVDCCGDCDPCSRGLGLFCEKGAAITFNGTEMDRTTPTYGGFSSHIVVAERCVFRIPPGLDLARAAPLLCAGTTIYSPLRQWSCKKGDRVGVVGLGGLGHLAVKLAASMGAEVTVLSTTCSKETDARRLGAQAFESTREEATFRKLAGRFDLLIDTVSAPHDYDRYLGTLRIHGVMVVVGVPPEPISLGAMSLIRGNKRLAGSGPASIPETQEMLDYCARHQIDAEVEIIPIQKVNEAYERLARNDVRYRFVIDMASLN